MDIEQMKLEALCRQLQSAVAATNECNRIVGCMIAAANDENIPVDLETLKKANATRYAEAVRAAQCAVAELKTLWP